MHLVPSSNAWGLLREKGGGDGHLFWIVLFVECGAKQIGDLGKDSLCWELVLRKEVQPAAY